MFCLDPVVCPARRCSDHPAYLAWPLDELAEGRVVNQVVVDGRRRVMRGGVERMLSVR